MPLLLFMLIGVYKSIASRTETPRQTLTGQQEEEASNIYVTCFWAHLRAPYGPGSAEPLVKPTVLTEFKVGMTLTKVVPQSNDPA